MLAVPAAASAQSGGAAPSPAPSIEDVRCARDCAGTLPQLGSVLRIAGSHLQSVREVTFLGGVAPGDEVTAAPETATTERVVVRVPPGAQPGPVMVTDTSDQTSVSAAALELVETVLPGVTSGPIATAVTQPKAFVDGTRAPTLAYRLDTPEPAEVTVDVVRERSGRTAATIDEGLVQPGETRIVSWGRRPGSYRFVVSIQGQTLSASTAQNGTDAFRILGYQFPLPGKHYFGDGLGANRGHQGTDVFAACDMPVRAARGGRVKFKEFQSRAGNYLVIDETRSGYDSAYMHLRDPALPETGDRVHTGEVIGYVGMTGAASECHLHFEYWTAPGWYSGGSPVDALAYLKAWDRVS